MIDKHVFIKKLILKNISSIELNTINQSITKLGYKRLTDYDFFSNTEVVTNWVDNWTSTPHKTASKHTININLYIYSKKLVKERELKEMLLEHII